MRARVVDRDLEGAEQASREPVFLAQQPEEDVLGAHAHVLEGAGLLLRQDERLAGPARQAGRACRLAARAARVARPASRHRIGLGVGGRIRDAQEPEDLVPDRVGAHVKIEQHP